MTSGNFMFRNNQNFKSLEPSHGRVEVTRPKKINDQIKIIEGDLNSKNTIELKIKF